MIELSLRRAIEQLHSAGAKRVFVQIPEGLKTRTEEIFGLLGDFETVVGMDPCFGACDLREDEAERMGCDTILHIGHNYFQPAKKLKVVYAPLPYRIRDFDKFAARIVDHFKKKNIKSVGLTTTAQFLEYTYSLKDIFAEADIRAYVSGGKRIVEAQLLGCNYSASELEGDTLLFFGDGLFHPLGLSFAAEKEVIVANPLTREIFELKERKGTFLKQRITLIEMAKDGKEFAVLVSTKPGQTRMSRALEIKKKLEGHGKNARIYSADMLSPENLLGIRADVLVNTACPRIAIDDFANYKQPIINASEVDYLFGKSYDDYQLDKEY